MIGTLINSRYQIVEQLGQGGMGIVYRAADTLLGREVAMKMLSRQLLGTDGQDRLLQEARAVAQLDHPHIVAIYDAGETDGQPFIVMQFVEGHTLDERPPSDLVDIARISRQLCDALHYAHQKGIIHRDIKPANVIITPDCSARLMDFGLAHSPASRLTQAGALLGTVQYIAPEQAMGKPVDHRADLYALGVMLFELVTGQLPFDDENPFVVITQRLQQQPPPPSDLRPDLPPEWEALILGLLHKDPALRPSSAADVKQILEQLLGHTEDTAVPVPYSIHNTPALIQSPVYTLPAAVTSFVGREAELEEITRLLLQPNCRLLTLTGPGGIGKTRLALQAAGDMAQRYPQGTCFVPLNAVAEPDNLISAIAGALQFPFDTHSSNLPPHRQFLDFLGQRALLLLLDNFEHLLAGADLAADILTTAPQVKLLVTSRERLDLQAEWVYEVAGLPLNGGRTAAAGQLFQDRAQQVDAHFHLTEADEPHLTHICRRTAGMPLAIELATTWVSILSCREIADEMQQNMDFLASTRRDLPERHRSVRAVFDFSWHMLTVFQQTGLSRASVIVGSFSRAAAQRVAGLNLMQLTELVNKSLLRRTADSRYEIHPLLRQYAAEKLAATPDEAADVTAEHGRFYTQFLIAHKMDLRGGRMEQAHAAIRADRENIRRAVLWTLVHGEETAMREALNSLYQFYIKQGWHEGVVAFHEMVQMAREQIDTNDGPYQLAVMYQIGFQIFLGEHQQAAALPPIIAALRQRSWSVELAYTLFAYGSALIDGGEYGLAQEALTEAITLAEQASEIPLAASARLFLGWLFYVRGEIDGAEREFHLSLAGYRRFDDRLGEAYALSKIGLVADAAGQFETAWQRHQDAGAVFAALGSQAGEAYALSRQSISAYCLGRYERAYWLGQRALKIARTIGHRFNIAASLGRMGFAALALGRNEESRDLFREALTRAVEFSLTLQILYALGGLAAVLVQEGEIVRAAELYGLVDAHPQLPALYRQVIPRALGDVIHALPTEALTRGRQADLLLVVGEVLGTGGESA